MAEVAASKASRPHLRALALRALALLLHLDRDRLLCLGRQVILALWAILLQMMMNKIEDMRKETEETHVCKSWSCTRLQCLP